MTSLQSRRNFGERVLGISLMKIMAAIFDFNGRKKFVPRGRSTIKYKEKGRGGEVKIMPARSIVILENSVRPRMEFLIGAVKLQLSVIS